MSAANTTAATAIQLSPDDIGRVLAQPLFARLSPLDHALLIGHLLHVELEDGAELYQPEQAPEQVYLLAAGFVALVRDGAERLLEAGVLGAEIALGSAAYLGTARARGRARVVAVAATVLATLAARDAAFKRRLFQAYAALEGRPARPLTPARAGASGLPGSPGSSKSPAPGAPSAPPSSAPPGLPRAAAGLAPAMAEVSARRSWTELGGWLLALTLPPLVWYVLGLHAQPGDICYFLAILTCTVVLWLFNLVPAFVPPLFSLLAIILFDVASPAVAAAGFSSTGFFMLLSIFAIGALMIMSGLTFRISLWILRRVPPTPAWYNRSLFFYGLILTPVIPSQLARMVIVSPFLSTLMDAGPPAGDRSTERSVAHAGQRATSQLVTSQLVTSALSGVSLAAAVFLTGKPANLIVFGLFDPQTQFSFEWLPWLVAASFSGALLVAAHFVLSRLLFGRPAGAGIAPHVIGAQLRALGPLRRAEWCALLAIGGIAVGVASSAFHRIEIPWLALAILVALLLFGALNNDDLSKQVDWSILLFIGSIVAWIPIMKSNGIDAQLTVHLSGVGALMKSHFGWFIGALCLAVVVLRLALPELVVEILLVTLLFPLAHTAGVSPWVVGFVILLMAEAYIFPYQAPYHSLLQNQLAARGQAGRCDAPVIVRFNLLLTLARVAVVYLSFPFWSLMDII